MSAARSRAFRSLAHYNSPLWAAGALVSNLGAWVQRTAQDWLALMALSHGSAAAAGVVMALQFAPQLLLLPWTGSAADHSDQRKLLMLTQTQMGLLALALCALTVAGVARPPARPERSPQWRSSSPVVAWTASNDRGSAGAAEASSAPPA